MIIGGEGGPHAARIGCDFHWGVRADKRNIWPSGKRLPRAVPNGVQAHAIRLNRHGTRACLATLMSSQYFANIVRSLGIVCADLKSHVTSQAARPLADVAKARQR
jgi:hypothetical protein